jgi:hypothetical protein
MIVADDQLAAVMRRTIEPRDLEIAIGPHPWRPDWHVLRVSYARRADHDARIAAALAALVAPASTDGSASLPERGDTASTALGEEAAADATR